MQRTDPGGAPRRLLCSFAPPDRPESNGRDRPAGSLPCPCRVLAVSMPCPFWAFFSVRSGFGAPVLAEEPHGECDQPGEREQLGEQGGAEQPRRVDRIPVVLRAEGSRLSVGVYRSIRNPRNPTPFLETGDATRRVSPATGASPLPFDRDGGNAILRVPQRENRRATRGADAVALVVLRAEAPTPPNSAPPRSRSERFHCLRVRATPPSSSPSHPGPAPPSSAAPTMAQASHW